MDLKNGIVDRARQLGFTLVGVTSPDPPLHFEVFQAWLAAGRHGEMTYLSSERSLQRRADPQNILSGCKSIIVLGTPYPPSQSRSPTNEKDHAIYGRVSSYAWGLDYHDVLAERLAVVVDDIDDLSGWKVSNRWYADTGPILERDFAQRAGLGWIGRNTCLINPRGGSYFFLSVILLGIELEPDQPFETDHCGSCTRCIDACPTACILPDRTIDARRCISYLTIELKGAIPDESRTQMGDWVFGCDVCQQVCPWNLRFARSSPDPAFSPLPGVPFPDLPQELSLDAAAFNRKFKSSPIKRAKRRGYLRNAAVALGNAGDPAAIPALIQALHHNPEPIVRTHAAWALGKFKCSTPIEALIRALKKEEDEGVLVEIQLALKSLGIEGDRMSKNNRA